nr:MAG TPA: hypothetical protein [Caudoviricetes sp.]
MLISFLSSITFFQKSKKEDFFHFKCEPFLLK